MYQQHGMYYEGQGGDMPHQHDSWAEVNAVLVSRGGASEGVSSVAFDRIEELVWCGTEGGSLVSHLGPELTPYTAFQAHPAPITSILPDVEGVLSLSTSSLKYHTRGGLQLLSCEFGPEMAGLSSLVDAEGSSLRPATTRTEGLSKVLLSGAENDSVFLYDVSQERTLKQVLVNESGVTAMERGTRHLCCGSGNGEITLHDPSTLRVIQSFRPHSGGVYDVAIKSDLLITCGWSQRRGSVMIDSLIHVYDLRSLREITPLSFPSGPVLLQFMPKLSSTVLAAAQSGAFQMVDYTHGGRGGVSYYQVTSATGAADVVTSVDVSQTGDCVCFGDAAGFLHCWTSREEVTLNDFSRPTDIVDPVPPPPPVQLPFDGSLSSMPLPADGDGEALLSDWPSTLTFGVRQHHPIPESIASQLRTKDFVGYATNTGPNKIRRNQALPQLTPVYPSPAHLLTDDPQAPAIPSATSGTEEQRPSRGKAAKKRPRPPKRYRVMEVNTSRLDYDTSSAKHYNKTSLGSLEYTQPESYCNSLLLMLFNVEELRTYCINHLCDQEFCVTCELGFLYRTQQSGVIAQRSRDQAMSYAVIDMLSISAGRNCHSSNVVRAIKMLPEARDAGILLEDTVRQDMIAKRAFAPSFAPSSWRQHTSTTFTHILERFTSFLFERLHLESGKHRNPAYPSQPRQEPRAMMDELFGYRFNTTSLCLSCGEQVGMEPSKSHFITLGYPNLQESGFSNPSFATSLRKSLCGEFDLMDEDGMCPACGTYQPIRRTRELTSLPHKLCVLANVNEERMQLWRPKAEEMSQGEGPPRSPAGSSWFPSKLRMTLDVESTPTHLHIQELAGSNVTQDTGVYRLCGLVCNIHDHESVNAKREHFVSYVMRQPAPEELSKMKRPKPQWYLMNDVSVTKVTEKEVMSFTEEWKIPSILMYELVTAPDESVTTPLSAIEPICPVTKDVFSMPYPFPQRCETPTIQPEQVPGKGDRTMQVSLDAEFVWIGESAEAEAVVGPHEDHLGAGRFSVARVSVVTSKGGGEFFPIIDDYIASRENIKDYLTRFSGIQPGDLDPDKSPHPITTMKHVYLRLRYLVDVGCTFVGHGLGRDFRMINILVPREQVIDTVHLFHRSRERMVKLRFLASYLLAMDIQKETHCSVEDARTASLLYDRYLELSEHGNFDKVLAEIYRVGRECHWDVGCISAEDRERIGAISRKEDTST